MSLDAKAILISDVIKQASAEKLCDLLSSIDGKKDLVLDKELIRSLDFFTDYNQLKKCNVEKVIILEAGSIPGVTERCVYLIKPTLQNTKIVSDHINASQYTDTRKLFWIIHVPRKLYASQLRLEKEGVFGYVTQLEFPLGFLTLDKDVFSLEIPDFFEAFYLKGDLGHIHLAAIALVQLCKICGPIPKIFGQGRCSKLVVDLMNRIMKETDLDSSSSENISHLIILDRDIDYASVFLSQLTYEGILDDFFGINSGRVVFPEKVTGKNESIKVILDSNDVVFEEIRNSYFASVFGFLRSRAKEIQAKINEASSMTVRDIKKFVSEEMKKLQRQHTSLSLHIGACEVILQTKNEDNFQERLRIERNIIENHNPKECITYIEDVINKQEPYASALRLMCLLSISQDGFLSADYNSLAMQFRQSYGCQYILTLFRLKKLGLLVELPPLLPAGSTKSSKISEVATVQASKIAEKVATAVAFPKYNPFKTISKKFNLIPVEDETVNLKDPTDMSYVFGGSYVPLIGRITEHIIEHDSLKQIEDNLKLLPGSTIVDIKADKETGSVALNKDVNSKTILVYILGGVTHAEVAALRLLAKLKGCKILIATTSFISGASMMRLLSPPEDT